MYETTNPLNHPHVGRGNFIKNPQNPHFTRSSLHNHLHMPYQFDTYPLPHFTNLETGDMHSGPYPNMYAYAPYGVWVRYGYVPEHFSGNMGMNESDINNYVVPVQHSQQWQYYNGPSPISNYYIPMNQGFVDELNMENRSYQAGFPYFLTNNGEPVYSTRRSPIPAENPYKIDRDNYSSEEINSEEPQFSQGLKEGHKNKNGWKRGNKRNSHTNTSLTDTYSTDQNITQISESIPSLGTRFPSSNVTDMDNNPPDDIHSDTRYTSMKNSSNSRTSNYSKTFSTHKADRNKEAYYGPNGTNINNIKGWNNSLQTPQPKEIATTTYPKEQQQPTSTNLLLYSKKSDASKLGSSKGGPNIEPTKSISSFNKKNNNLPISLLKRFSKTKFCTHFKEGNCSRGLECPFAHSESEIKHPPDLYKTKLCDHFQQGHCPNNLNCRYAHHEQELRSTPEFYKTSMCILFQTGECQHNGNCRFAHGMNELRTRSSTPSNDQSNSVNNSSKKHILALPTPIVKPSEQFYHEIYNKRNNFIQPMGKAALRYKAKIGTA